MTAFRKNLVLLGVGNNWPSQVIFKINFLLDEKGLIHCRGHLMNSGEVSDQRHQEKSLCYKLLIQAIHFNDVCWTNVSHAFLIFKIPYHGRIQNNKFDSKKMCDL